MGRCQAGLFHARSSRRRRVVRRAVAQCGAGLFPLTVCSCATRPIILLEITEHVPPPALTLPVSAKRGAFGTPLARGGAMDLHELRHETLDLLQTVYVLTARLRELLPEDAAEARGLLDQLTRRARLCKDRVMAAGVPDAVPEPADEADLPRLRVVVVDDDPATRQYLCDTLATACGHKVVAAAGTGREMIRRVLEQTPDLVVMDIHLPDLDGLEALRQVTRAQPVAAVAITGDQNPELIRRALEDNILAYLLKPV